MDIDTLRDELRQVAYEVVEQLIGKRADYGTKNIEITGRFGLAVRIQDKASRLLTLEAPDAPEPNYESREDTYRDLIGYALIGLVPGGWELPIPSTLIEEKYPLPWEETKIGGTDD